MLVAGFGVMELFWQTADRHAPYPGLPRYLSATVGDGLLLPAVAGCWTYCAALIPRPVIPARLALRAGAAAGLLAVLVQAAWVLDPRPERNWTLPVPHLPTAAGVWHGVFFVATSGWLTWLAVDCWVRLRTTRRQAARTDPANALYRTGCLLTAVFLLLAAYDDRTALGRGSGRATAAGTALSVALTALLSVTTRRPTRTSRHDRCRS